MNLEGKVAYITGGSKGIGYGVAKALLNMGMKVAISGRNQDSVDSAVENMRFSNSVLGIQSDVSCYEDEEKAIKATATSTTTLCRSLFTKKENMNLVINWDVTPELIPGWKTPNLYGLLFVTGLIIAFFVIKRVAGVG